jgi:hypothetical protein
MKPLMHDVVLHALDKNDKNKRNVKSLMTDKLESNKYCNFWGNCPCVWITERQVVIANDENANGHTFTIYNKTPRKITYKHMLRAVNGPGEKGINKSSRVC